ncbi:MAG: hypothetical protein A2089_11905 [Elusimicrobia bacterium GWD2_63_28]|nr:MAG: hypothetical protein A2089_11905 [Elusimicrobia bacterium GWD2_63_28]
MIGMMTGAADAADIFDLHRVGAAEAAARVAAGQVPQVPPVFPAAPWNNNWPGTFPQPQQGGIDTCVFTEFSGGKCWLKCGSGNTIAEPPLKTGPDGAMSDTCATHVFLPLPAGRKGGRTMEDWRSVDLLAADGTQISVDYVPADLGGKVNATHVWVSVRNPGFSGSEKVSVRLSNYYEAKPGSPEALKESKELELPFNGWSFQAKFPDMSLFEAFHSWQNDFRQSLKATVDGANLHTGSGMGVFSFKMPGKPAWADDERKAERRLKGCLFNEAQGDTCVYKCEGGKNYVRPMNRPSPFGDEPVVPCPAFVIQF